MKQTNSIVLKLLEDNYIYVESDQPVTVKDIVNCIAVLINLLPKDHRKELISRLVDSIENDKTVVTIQNNTSNKNSNKD